MKHVSLFLLCLLQSVLLHAQIQSRHAAFTTGGSFGASGNRVGTSYYEIATGTQVQVDSALGDFSNAVCVEQQYIYSHIGRSSLHPSGGDVVYKYNILGQTRVDSALNVPGLVRMKIHKNYLVVTRGYGASANYLQIYNKNSLASGPVFQDTIIPAYTDGIVVVRDTLYVSYTEADTGRLGVFSLSGTNPEFVKTITLDTLQSGIGQLFTDGNFIYGLCERVIYPPPSFNPVVVSAGIMKMNTQSGLFNFTATPNAKGGIGLLSGILYANYSTGPGAFDLAGNTIIVNPALNLSYSGATLDTIQQEGYFMTTDYFSYGKIYIIDGTGMILDSINTHISGGPIDILYNGLPVAITGYGNTPTDVPFITNLLLISGDSDGGAVTYTITQAPQNGNAGISGSILTYTPNTGFIGTDSLEYTVTDIWNESISARFYISVGLSQMESENLVPVFYIYPNPAQDFIYVNFSTQDNIRIYILDNTGKIMRSETISSGTPISVSDLSPGVYIITAEDKNGFVRFIRK